MDDNLQLTSGSPCIDAADNFSVPQMISIDLLGNPRFVDDLSTPDTGQGDPPVVDMGAYEFQYQPSEADLNGDGIVDGGDLGILLGVWGQTDPPFGDLNNDGVVNGSDLGLLLGEWTG